MFQKLPANNMMTISVLMSVYKAEDSSFLDRALQSVWNDQTCKPYEIILIKDGPLTIELDDVIDKWKDALGASLIILRNDINLGLTKSLNKGLKHASGEFIARMDSDDISHPLRFEIQSSFLSEHPDIDVVGGSLQEFDDNNPCLNVRHYPENPEHIKKYIAKASPLAHPTVMMRRRIFDAGISYDERYRTSQDLALWYDALAAGYKISNVPDITLYFRLGGDVFKRRSKAKAFNEFKIYMRGIYRLHGFFTYYYIYPLSRLAFRLMPESIIKWIYNSKIRSKALG